MRISRYLSFVLGLFIVLSISNSCSKRVDTSYWDVVDSNSLLIFEASAGNDSLFNIIKPFQGNGNGYLVAFQKKSKSEIDLIFSFKSNKLEFDSLIIRLEKKSKGNKLVSRSYDGFKIYELINEVANDRLSFVLIDDLVVVSKSPFLVENCIRVYKSKTKLDFKKNNPQLFGFALLKNDAGNLYVNFNGLSEVVSFIPTSLISVIPFFNEWNNKLVFDINRNSKYVVMNGFSPTNDSSLVFFQEQNPVPITITRFVPSYTNALVHFGISDLILSSRKEQDSIQAKAIESEFALMNQEASENTLAIIGLRNATVNELKLITNEYHEEYAGYEIQSINQVELKNIYKRFLPNKVFSFGIVMEGYLLMAQTLEDIKQLVDAIENEETWGKTVNFQSFNERCLQESNISIFIKRPNLISESSPFYKEHHALMRNLKLSEIEWTSLQYSALDNHFYASLILGFADGNNSISAAPSQKLDSKLSASSLDLVNAFFVRNLNSQALIVQERDFSVSLVSPKEGVLWKQNLNEEVIGDVRQIDYYKNGKLQYLITTKSKIHLIDRLGRYVTGFPKTIKEGVQFLSVVDYDKSKNYRYLVSTAGKNSIHLFDKDLNNLDDWGPKSLSSPPIVAGEHFRAGGKDYFLIILKDGQVNIFSRRGEQAGKFQLPGKDFVSGDFYLKSGMNLSSSQLHVVNKEGAVYQYSLDGKLISNYNLVRGNKSSFSLKRTNNGNRFYFVRIDSDKLTVFSDDGKLLYERQNQGSTNLQVQIVERSSTKVIFSFYDDDQKINYLYDQTGKEISGAVESEITPVFGQLNSKSALNLYTFPKNSIVIKSVE